MESTEQETAFNDEYEDTIQLTEHTTIDPTLQLINDLKAKDEVEYFKTFDASIDKWEFCNTHKYFVPLICEHGDESLALTYAGGILSRISCTPGMENHLFAFANQRSPNGSIYYGETPLGIAFARNWRKMTEVLIENCADETHTGKWRETPLDRIYHKFPSVMMNQLDKNIVLVKDVCDDSNELLWKVKYRYRPITGSKPKKIHSALASPTDLLVSVLRLETEKRNEVLSHPLVRLLVTEESIKLRRWIQFSIAGHVLYCIFNALFITSLTVGEFGHVSNSSVNSTGTNLSWATRSNQSESAIVTISGFLTERTPQLFSFSTLYFISLVMFHRKQHIELRLAPNEKYYFSQWENFGQWILLLIGYLQLVFRFIRLCWPGDWTLVRDYFCAPLCVVAILLVGLLVQGQGTKLDCFGAYNILLLKAVKRFMWFALAYSPVILTFFLLFNLLLSKHNPDFDAGFGFFKGFAMFTGDLSYKDTFGGQTLTTISKWLVNTIFVVFGIIVIIILSNILVALTIDDMKNLKQESLASHMAAQLELIHILGVFKPWFQEFNRGIAEQIRTCCRRTNGNEALDGPQNNIFSPEAPDFSTYNKWIEEPFQKLPDDIQKCIKLHFHCKQKQN